MYSNCCSDILFLVVFSHTVPLGLSDNRGSYPQPPMIGYSHHGHRYIGNQGTGPMTPDYLVRLNYPLQDLDSTLDSYGRTPGLLHPTVAGDYNPAQRRGVDLARKFPGYPSKDSLELSEQRKTNQLQLNSPEGHGHLRHSADGIRADKAPPLDQSHDAASYLCRNATSVPQWVVHQPTHRRSVAFSF